MKEYLDQVFYEGLGATLYNPLEKKFKKIKNSNLRKIVINILKVIYFIFAIILALLILYYKL